MSDPLVPGAPKPDADLAALKREVELLKSQFASKEATEVAAPAGAENPVAFMVMPFGPEDLQVVYDDFVKPVVELKCGLKCVRGDDMFGSDVIMEDVLAAIRKAKVVIADLTGQNPNVFYEVGIAHASGTPVLLITQSLDDVPFDLRHRRVLPYDYTPHGCKRLEIQLEEHLRQMFEL
jgi:hypothetical protein